MPKFSPQHYTSLEMIDYIPGTNFLQCLISLTAALQFSSAKELVIAFKQLGLSALEASLLS